MSVIRSYFILTCLSCLLCNWIPLDAYEGDLYQTRPECSLSPVRTDKESSLISHVKHSIMNAKRMKSKIDNPAILEIDGMSTSKTRHLLNNLCSLPNSSYLEIGVWKGSTWISALYNNYKEINEAAAIDNWSQFGGPKEAFTANCKTFLFNNKYKFIDLDSFQLNPLTLFTKPVNIYFYDGCHLQESQRKAFTYYNEIFDDVFIAVVDDWSSEVHRIGTFQAFDELHYEVLFEDSLPAGENEFWNGQYIAVIRR